MDSDFRAWVDQIKAAADPFQVATDLGLQHRGRRFFCPSCQPEGGKTPDLATGPEGFNCFKCGESGDVIALVQLVTGDNFTDAASWLGDRIGLAVPSRRQGRKYAPATARKRKIRRSSPGRPGGFAARTSTGKAPALPAAALDALAAFLDACRVPEGRALEYLTRRGISADVVHGLGVRFCGREYGDIMDRLSGQFSPEDLKAAGLLADGKKGLYPTFGPFYWNQVGFLVIPYRQEGRVVYLKARPPIDKAAAERLKVVRFLNTAGAVPCPLNLDGIAGADRVLICEGETDTMTALTQGFDAVGLPGWGAFKDDWARHFTGKAVFLVMDDDEGGRRGARDIAAKFDLAGLPLPRIVTLGNGQDLNEYFRDGMTEGGKE